MSTPQAEAATSERQATERVARENVKLEKRLLRLTGQAISDFNMIEPGDKVMVCLSGGKDSYSLLEVLLLLRDRAPVRFDIVAVNLDQKQPGFPDDVLPRYLRARGIDFHIETQDTYSVVTRVIPEGKTFCSLCSRLRRGILYRVAVVIRPLAYVKEADLARYAQARQFPIIPCNLCGSQDNLKRKEVKRMLLEWERRHPGRVENTFNALSRITPSHLMDSTLFNFVGLKATGEPLADGDIAFDEEPCGPEVEPTAGVIRFAEAE